MTIHESKSTSHFSQLQAFNINYHTLQVSYKKNRLIQNNE
jgi:hypothetical protein